jgi:hypothetical protein
MPRIQNADIAALVQRLTQDAKLDRADVDKLIDAAQEDGFLGRAEKKELRDVLAQHADKIESPELRERLRGFLAMRNAGVRNAVIKLERADGVIDANDAQAILEMVGADGRVSGREKYSLQAAMVAATMTDDAKELIRAAIDGDTTTPTTPTTPTLIDLKLPEVGGKKFQLSSEGFLTADGKKPFFDAAGAHSFYQSADAITRAEPGVLRAAPTATKQAMLTHLTAAFEAGKETSPLPEVARQEIRSGAASTLLALIEGAGSGETQLRKDALKLYFAQANVEPMHGLRASMYFNLERIKSTLPAASQVRLGELEKAVLPQKPPYDEWFADGERHIETKHYAHSDCWTYGTDPVTAYKRKGYTVVENHEDRTPPTWVLEKKNPNAPGGEVSIRIELVQTHDGIFQDMDDDDVNMVVYTGHSNLGGNVSEELRLGTEEKSSKLVMLAMCRGKQNMFEVANKYPSAHFLTTDAPSYFSSVMPMSLGMVEGALNLVDYDKMKADTPRIWDTNGNNNYFYPNEPRRYAYYDLDKDGVIDSRGAHVDRLYDIALKMPTAQRTDGVVRATTESADDFDGTNVLHAVQFLNTLMNYHVEKGHHTSAFKHGDGDNFLSGGWFDGPTSEKVRLHKKPDGKVEVQVNKGLADQSWAVLGAIVQFEATKLMLTERNGGTLTKKDEARAALFAGEYLAYMYCSLNEAVASIRAIGRDSQHMSGVSFQDLYQAMDADGHGYVTDKQVDALLQIV